MLGVSLRLLSAASNGINTSINQDLNKKQHTQIRRDYLQRCEIVMESRDLYQQRCLIIAPRPKEGGRVTRTPRETPGEGTFIEEK